MKKTINIVVCLLLILTFIPTFNSIAVQASDVAFVQDNFEDANLSTTPVSTGSIGNYDVETSSNKPGWVKNDSENFVQVTKDPVNANNRVLQITDKQNGDADKGGSTRTYNKNFVQQTTDQNVAVEFDFMAEEVGSSTRFRLMNKGGNAEIVSLETSGSALMYRTAAGLQPLLDKVAANTWYHVKVNANMPTHKFDISISGGANAAVHDQDFYQTVTDFGRFDVTTGNSSTSTYYLDNVQMYNTTTAPEAPASGAVGEADPSAPVSVTPNTDNTADSQSPAQASQSYLINDNFDDASWPTTATNTQSSTIGNYGTEVTSNKGTAWVFNPEENFAQIIDSPVQQGNKVLKIYDAQDGSVDKGGTTRIYNKSFTPQNSDKTAIVEFDLLGESFGSSTRFRLMNQGGNTALVSLETSGKNLVYRISDTETANLVEGIQPNTWYHFKITVDMKLAKYDLNVSGGTNTEVRNQPFYQSSTDFGRIDMNTGNSSTSALYLDNIQLYNPSVVPSQPANVEATAGNTQIKLTWSPARNASSYTIKRSTSPDGPFETVAANVTDEMFKDTKLTNETTYYYKVSGVNSVGEGSDSAIASVTPSSSVPLPGAPTVKAVAKNASVSLAWDPVQAADTYTVKRSSTENGQYEAIASGLTEPSFLDIGLENNTDYYYVVQASGVGGDGANSVPVKATAATAFANPTNLVAKVGNKSVELTWDQVPGAASYNVKRSTVSGKDYSTVATGVSNATYTDNTVENGETYFYVVTAVNGNQESMISSEAKAKPIALTPGAPKVPSGFKASVSEKQVALSWEPVQKATSYTVKRAAVKGGEYKEIASHLTDTSYVDTSVANGTTYYYVITASNDKGESAPTNEMSVLPTEAIVVAKDGSGDFTTIQAAVDSIPADNTARKVIYIKNGLYHEKVSVKQPYVSFIGESQNDTMIEWDDYGGPDGKSGNVGSTFASQTVAITGDYFTASNLTFKNSRAPRSTYGTAVALSVNSDQAIFTNVSILGYQDTLYMGKGKQYYRNAYIEGDVDFIFGEAPAVVFDQSVIKSVGTTGYVTAAAQKNPDDKGFVFINSRLEKGDTAANVYLGRPWKNLAKTVFINTWMDDHIRPEGWREWSGTTNHEQAFYAEYNSMGPGASAKDRVKWSNQLTAEEANQYTVPNIFGDWDPTQVMVLPYMSYTVDTINVLDDAAVETPVVGDQQTGGTDNTPATDNGANQETPVVGDQQTDGTDNTPATDNGTNQETPVVGDQQTGGTENAPATDDGGNQETPVVGGQTGGTDKPSIVEIQPPKVVQKPQIVYWKGAVLKKGQIGMATISKNINLWKHQGSKLVFVRILKAGEQYRIYNYDGKHGGQYGVGAGYYITNMKGYVKYETPTKAKLALANQ